MALIQPTSQMMDPAGVHHQQLHDPTQIAGPAALPFDPAVQADDTATVEEEASPVIDITISNVVASFSTRCHLNLRTIAMEGMHVILRKESGMVSMKIRKPYTTASIWSSGKITCTGATSEEQSKVACRRFARRLQQLGFRCRFANYRVVNVLGTCSLPFGIKIQSFSREFPKEASYEPELHPGVTYRIKEPKATLKIFSTGSITVTAPRVANVQSAIEHIFPLVYTFRMEKARLSQTDIQQTTEYLNASPSRLKSKVKPQPEPQRAPTYKSPVKKRRVHPLSCYQGNTKRPKEDWSDTSDDDDFESSDTDD